jgi:hypothetical protein
MLLAALLALAPTSPAQDAKSAEKAEIACVVVDRPQYSEDEPLHAQGWRFAAANLVVMKDGTLIASVERVRHNDAHLGSSLCRSTDKGAHWVRITPGPALEGASLFDDDGTLYLMGSIGGWTSASPVIYRSEDHGETWSHPRNAVTGYILGGAKLDACSGPALLSGGRVWKAFTRPFGQPTATGGDRALVASAALGADLLRAEAWRWSSELPLEGKSGTIWERTRLVADKVGPPRLIVYLGNARTCVASMSADGLELKKCEPQPGGSDLDALGARMERDPKSGSLFALAAFPDSTQSPVPSASLCSEVSLLASRDGSAWDLRTVLLRGNPCARFSCADWAVDGEDLVAVVGGSLAESSDTRALLFLRVPKFRERKFGDPPASMAGAK